MKKVFIIGGHPEKLLVPDRDDYEYWSVSSNLWSNLKLKKIDLVFELHSIDLIKEKIELLNDFDGDIICGEASKLIKNSIIYPIYDIVAEFGIKTVHQNHLSYKLYALSTISYMIAYAIYNKYDIIELYGVKMAMLEEYNIQLPSCEYMIGFARGKGIDVIIHESNVCNTSNIYQYESLKRGCK